MYINILQNNEFTTQREKTHKLVKHIVLELSFGHYSTSLNLEIKLIQTSSLEVYTKY